MTPRNEAEDSADSFALFRGGVNLFGSGRRRGESEQALIMEAARLTPKLIESHSHGRTMEPGFRVLAVRVGMPGKLEKYFDGEFLGASRVAGHSCDHAGNARVLGAEQCFQIEVGCFRPHVRRDFARRYLT
jgi:hypothetical protein